MEAGIANAADPGIARRYDRDPEEVSVAVQLLDGGGLDEATFDATDRDDAFAAATARGRRVRRMFRPNLSI